MKLKKGCNLGNRPNSQANGIVGWLRERGGVLEREREREAIKPP